MHIEYPLIEILDGEYRAFCLDHNLDDERIANARLAPGVRRWLRDHEARLNAARVLAPLAARALVAEYDTEEHEAAHNAFADAIAPYMTNAQRRQWDNWCLKATGEEQIDEAFRILGLPLSRDQRQIEEASTDGATPALPPSVADYFEQKLGAKLPNPHTGGDATEDRTHPASPAHPEFHIHTGCGIDCKAAIDAASAVLEFIRQHDLPDDPEGASAAIIGAAALFSLATGALPHDIDLARKANTLLKVVRLASEADAETTIPYARQVAADLVNCFVYG